MAYVPQPDGQQVADFLGQGGDPSTVALATEHVGIVTAMVRGYTRGNGFDPVAGDPADDLAAVIVTATARLLANPEQLAHDVGAVSFRGGFTGWSLAETFVLNRYRRRAA
ncbi:MAG: hypothetical protein M3529_07195 [Actinomycetota bacterium]|nr:hypothetical protein [Actinomycetota bacterium]